MFKGRSLMTVFMLLALALFTSGLCYAQESPVVEVIQENAAVENLVPEVDSCLEEETMTLEELTAIFGAKKVCGARCGGWPYVNCSQVCGDAASCRNGYCIYL